MSHYNVEPIYAPTLCDLDEIRDCAKLMVGGQVTEIRALDAIVNGDRSPATYTGYFDNADALVSAVGTIKSAKGIYLTPNPVDRALFARAANRLKRAGKGDGTQDTHVLRRHWLLIDCDPVRPSGVSSTAEEHDLALSRTREIDADLHERGWPAGIIADSGNGGHVLYRIDLPPDDDGLVQRCLEALAQRFDDERVKVDAGVYNPSRIWKLYGTPACKGDDIPERPHRRSRILHRADELLVVPTDLLEALAAERGTSQTCTQTAGGQAFDLEAFIERHKLDVVGPEPWSGAQGVGRRWVFNASPLCEHHDGAAYIAEHAGGAITAGCHHNSCSWEWRDLRGRYEPRRQQHSTDIGGASAVCNTSRSPIITRLSDVQPQPLEWLWLNRIPLGKLTLYAGDPGLGKSFTTLDIAARVSRGASWPDMLEVPQPVGSVILFNAEDDLETTIRPRLDRAGADVERIVAIQGVADAAGNGQFQTRHFNLGRDLPMLERAIADTPGTRLVVIDPISAYCGGVDSHRNADVRALLAPLADLAARHRVAIVAVTHLNKAVGGKAVYRASGSLAFAAAARAVWVVVKDPENPDRRLILPAKMNLAPDSTGLAYSIVDGAVAWEREGVRLTADEAFAAELESGNGGRGAERREAMDWLRDTLGVNGPMAAIEVIGAAREYGIAEKTLRRAFKDIGGSTRKSDFAGEWLWTLPSQGGQDARVPDVAIFDGSEHLRHEHGGEEVLEWSA